MQRFRAALTAVLFVFTMTFTVSCNDTLVDGADNSSVTIEGESSLAQEANKKGKGGGPGPDSGPATIHTFEPVDVTEALSEWQTYQFVYEGLVPIQSYHLGVDSRGEPKTAEDFFGCPLGTGTCYAFKAEVSGFDDTDTLVLVSHPVNRDPRCEGTTPGPANLNQSCAHDTRLTDSERRLASLFMERRGSPRIPYANLEVDSATQRRVVYFLWSGQRIQAASEPDGSARYFGTFYPKNFERGYDEVTEAETNETALRFSVNRSGYSGSSIQQVDCTFGDGIMPCTIAYSGFESSDQTFDIVDITTELVTQGRGKKATRSARAIVETSLGTGEEELWATFLSETPGGSATILTGGAPTLPTEAGCHRLTLLQTELYYLSEANADFTLPTSAADDDATFYYNADTMQEDSACSADFLPPDFPF